MATKWMDPQEIVKSSRILAAFVLVQCGFAAWDVLRTLPFDLSIIRGKRPWRWPMVLYFTCRICMLLHIFSMAVNLNALSEIPCQEVTWISKVTDAIGTCGASLILVLRTRAVWHRSWKATGPLLVLFAGQIVVWCQTFRFSKAQWDPQRRVCAVISTAPAPVLITVFAYTMAFDLIILIVCTWRLATGHNGSSLGKLLLRDGIAYFCAVFGANFVQMVFAILQLNPPMNLMCLSFALVVSVIASTTIFRNVFTAYDAFSSGVSPSSNAGSRGFTDPYPTSRTNGGRFNVSGGARSNAHTATDIPLGHYSPHEGISVHKMVDIDVDGVAVTHSKDGQTMSDDNSLMEKHRAIV
ncbi:hypothetical protein BKA70DRAFT_1567892 [Coprinopsis sp. MPI-PUGE-AT-0042]|nr:hypothetical protein BKA70DRAFT_1567892 [Coprinopsis sp. MPI-PUGE-AT-0042]